MRYIKDYYHSHYMNVNKNFNIKKYQSQIFREYGEILSKNKQILDVGCGAGFLLKALELKGYKNLTGIEIDKNQFLEAKKILNYSKLINETAITYLKKNKKKYDIIFIYDLIEHLKKDKIIPFLKLIRESLNTEGIAIIKTPNMDSPFFSGRMRYNDFTHEISFNENSIRMVLLEAGFNKISCKKTKSRKFVELLRKITEFPLRIYLYTYIGREAFRIILTPNFIVIVKK